MDLSATNFRGERKKIKVESLIQTPELQGRVDVGLVKKRSLEVAELLTKPDGVEVQLDPIKVIHLTAEEVTPDGKRVGPGYYVVDGNTTTLGHKAAGRSTIDAVVRVGTWADAVDVATSANADQVALPRTREDKERQLLMSFANHPERSARWHAEHCRVSRDLANRKWANFERTLPKEVREKIQSEGKVGKGGKRQSATKKKPAKSKAAASQERAADWRGFEQSFSFTTRFIDHLAEIGGKVRVGKVDVASKAHEMHKAFGELMLEWKDWLKKSAEEAAERARANEAEAKAAKAATTKKEDERGTGKES